MSRICPKCNQTNNDTALRCKHCGLSFENATTEVDVSEFLQDELTVFPVTDSSSPKENGEVEVVDTRDIVVPEDVLDDSDNLGGALMQGGLILYEASTRTTFKISADDLDEILIGRTHSGTNYIPTVDLGKIDGHQFGVSRRHASLRREKSLLLLLDHHSVNGTFLNGQKLVPDQPRIVRDKDIIRLGGMALQVIYVNKPANNS